jgi:hypothetical protein
MNEANTSFGFVDTAPSKVAPAVAAALSDDNVLALLDTSLQASVELSGLAASHASDPRVRALAQSTMRSHEALVAVNADLARSIGASTTISDLGPLEGHHQMMERLRMLDGPRFDAAYLEYFVDLDENVLEEVNEELDEDLPGDVSEHLVNVKAALATDLKAAKPLLIKATDKSPDADRK